MIAHSLLSCLNRATAHDDVSISKLCGTKPQYAFANLREHSFNHNLMLT